MTRKRKPPARARAKPKAKLKPRASAKTKPIARTKAKTRSAAEKGTTAKRAQRSTARPTAKAPTATVRAKAQTAAVRAKAQTAAVRTNAKAPIRAKAKAKAKARSSSRPRTPALAAVGATDSRADLGAHVDAAWRVELRAAVEAGGPDFAAYLTGLGLTGLSEELPWEYADMPELIGLEQWGTELALRDRRAGIGALVRVAQHGLPIVLEHGDIGIDGMGFRSSEPTADGAPVETQIALAAAWLDAPDRAHLVAVTASIDRTRQLQIWDDDLIPNDDRAHWWYLDVGQCCAHAITRTHGSPTGPSYYEWPPEVCVGRGLVIAVRGLRYTRASIAKVLADVRDALLG